MHAYARQSGAVVLGALVYMAAAKLGFAMAFVHGTVSAVWPPAGVALVLVVLYGPRLLPAVILGEFLSNIGNGSSWALSLAFGVGNALEALAGRELLRRADFRPQLDRVRDVFALLGLAAVLSTLVSATVATTAFAVDGLPSSAYWDVWHTWWLGDLSGDLIVAPLLFVVLTTRRWRLPALRIVEAAGFVVALACVFLVAGDSTVHAGYLALPVLLWGALRFGQLGATFANAGLCGASIVTAAAAHSELARVEVAQRVLYTQNFVAVAAITTLAIAALLAERARVHTALRASEAEANELAAEQGALRRVAVAVAHETDPDEVLRAVAAEAAQLLDGAVGVVERFSPAAQLGRWESARPVAGGTVNAPIYVAGERWGRLSVEGFVPKPGDPQRLSRFAELAGIAVANAAARAELVQRATTDPLTGLANHRAFHERLVEEARRAERYDRPLAVALFDIDSFKAINDAAGHRGGDSVLIEVAARLRSAVRADALVGRLGGDEFGAILPECDSDGAYAVAERIRSAVAAEVVAARRMVTLSFGVSALEGVADPDALLHEADAALYAAKAGGRNQGTRAAAW